MTTILAIESSSQAASIAALNDDGLIFENLLATGFVHSQTLMTILKNNIECAKLKLSDVNLIAVSIGPGSFTGLRIGVATAKGLSTGLNVNCAGISTLKCLAANLTNLPVIACPVIDARNEFVYFTLFDMEKGETGKQLTGEEAILIDNLLIKLKQLNSKKPIVLVGNGAKKCYNKFTGCGSIIRPRHSYWKYGA